MSTLTKSDAKPTASEKRDSSAAATTTSKKRTHSQAIAFGRNYFYALGGTERTTRIHEDHGEIEIYTWGEPPWQSNKDEEDKIDQVVCTAQSTVFLTQKGKLYQTGTFHGHVFNAPTPVTIPLPLKCVQVSAGRHFCLGRMEGGLAVVSWGAGHFGQLGVGTSDSDSIDSQITYTPYPVIVERLLPHVIGSPIQQVAAGDWHALALTQSGRVWAWGSNRSQQCGRRPPGKSSTSGQAPTLLVPLPVPLEGSATQVSAGRSHSVAIVEGKVYCWGSSNHGQCGNLVRRSGVAPPKKVEGLSELTVTQVAAGGNHTLALTTGGRIFSWGGGTEGELGLGQAVPAQTKPRQIGDLDFVAIAAGQEWKSQQKLLPITEEKLSHLSKVPKIIKVFAGPSYSAAISSSGHVYVWGSNDAGQMGIPTPEIMPLKDPYNANVPTRTSTIRDLHVSTFDSRHNILLPTRIDTAEGIFVREVACGPNHMWCIGEERTEEQQDMVVGRTLYEVQEEQRMSKLHRARNSLLSKVHGATEDGMTEGTTTQTDNEEATEEAEDNGESADTTERTSSPLASRLSSAVHPTIETPMSEESSGTRQATPSTADQATPTTLETMTPPTFEVTEDSQTGQSSQATNDNVAEVRSEPSRAGRGRRFSLSRMLRRLSTGKSGSEDRATSTKGNRRTKDGES